MKGGVYVVTGTELHLPSPVGMQRISPTLMLPGKNEGKHQHICYKDELPVGEKRDGAVFFNSIVDTCYHMCN